MRMNKENEIWLTVKQAGNFLDVTERAIKKNCKAEKYTTKMVSGNGGQQYRILLSSLPQSAQDRYYAEKTAVVIAENTVDLGADVKAQEAAIVAERHKLRQAGLKRFNQMTKAKQAGAKARELLVHACQQHIRENGLGRVAGLYDFCQQLNDGLLPLQPRVIEAVPVHHGVACLKPATFKTWFYDYEKYGRIALVNDYGKRAGQGIIERNAELKRYVIGFILEHPHAKGLKIKHAIEAQKPELDVVSDKSINRYIKEWKAQNAQIWTYMTYPDKWKNVYMSAQGSHFEDVAGLNSLWEMDSTPGDWLLKDGRHSVIGCIDMYSRRLTFYVSKSSSADAVCRCFRKAALAWGLPDRVRTDNGKDYVSDRFMDVLRDLEIQQDLCIPFASEEKGTIERHLGTMLHGLLELLPGFIGHNVAQAQQIRSMTSFAERIMTVGETVDVELTSDELMVILDKWADFVYAQSKHGGLNGKTPAQVAALYDGSLRRVSDERVMDVLLAEPAGTRTINKKGIRFNNYDYIGSELTDHIGKQASLRYDEQDIGRLIVYVDTVFICIAQAPELSDISRQEVAIVAKKAQKKKQNEQAKELKEFKRDVAKNIPELVMNHRIDNADNVVRLPHKSVEHSTPALEQAAVAEKTLAGVIDEVVATPEVIQGKAKVIEFLTTKQEVNLLDMNDSQKYRYWQGLDSLLKEGDSLSDKEMNFHTRFQTTDTYRVISELEQDLASKALK